MDENSKPWSFRADYLTLPRKVVESLFKKQINLTELQIFAVVQCYSKTTQGCFVSNDSFSKICGVKERSIIASITHLKELGLLEQTSFDGRKRFLRATGWLGKNEATETETCNLNAGQTCDLNAGLTRDLNAGPIYNNNNLIKITKNIPAGEPQGGERKPSIYQKMALKFQKSIPIKRASPPSPKQEGNLLNQFCHREGIELARAKKVLKWYCSQFDSKKNPYSRKYLPLYVPQAISMRTFCQKFIDIECAMLRQKEASMESKEKREKPILPPEQQKLLKSMQEGFCFPPTALLSTLQKIIPGLIQALGTYRQRVERMVKVEVVREMYLNSLFTEQVFFRDYANWIEGELRHWENWSGDFSVFKVGAFPFQKYLNSVIMRQGFDRTGILGNILAE